MTSRYSACYLAFEQGRYDRADGVRRGQNPYAASGDGRGSAAAWWDGWDTEDDLRAVDGDADQGIVKQD